MNPKTEYERLILENQQRQDVRRLNDELRDPPVDTKPDNVQNLNNYVDTLLGVVK